MCKCVAPPTELIAWLGTRVFNHESTSISTTRLLYVHHKNVGKPKNRLESRSYCPRPVLMWEIMSSHECYRRQITQLNSEICVRISYFLGRNIKPALVQASLRYLATGFQDYNDLQELPDTPDTPHISRVLTGSTLWDHESRKRKRKLKNITNR